MGLQRVGHNWATFTSHVNLEICTIILISLFDLPGLVGLILFSMTFWLVVIVLFFDDFKDSQNVNYLLLKNSILKDKISHAYLINANHNEYVFDFVLSFIKMLLCNDHYSHNKYEKCKKCHLCKITCKMLSYFKKKWWKYRSKFIYLYGCVLWHKKNRD